MTKHKIIIIYESYHHHNTEKIAQVIAQRLKADLVRPNQIEVTELKNYNLIGIGSGIYFGKLHPKVRDFIVNMKLFPENKCFLFITSGIKSKKYAQNIMNQMLNKGVKVLDYFACKGFDTYGPLKLAGGINKGHPDLGDLYQAELFANRLINQL